MTEINSLSYLPVTIAGDFIFVSGQVGHQDPETGENVEGIEAQIRLCFKKISMLLKNKGASLDDIVKVTVFLKNEGDFNKMNTIYGEYFSEKKQTRSTIITNLIDPAMVVEIECIAYLACPPKTTPV
jgi:2-iminobutanoate/2-iminopropanoate deaminase